MLGSYCEGINPPNRRGSTAPSHLWVMLWECSACKASRACLSRFLSSSSPAGPVRSPHHHSLGSESSGAPAHRREWHFR